MKSTFIVLTFACATVAAAETWRPQESDVRVSCPLSIGGSFDARTSALSGSVTAETSGSLTLEGSFAVDLRTLDTGIALRNQHLRETYLEVGKGVGYDTATLSNIGFKGLDPGRPEGKGSFTGSLTLHGVTKTVTGAVDVQPSPRGLRVTAAFPVNLSDYSIPEPRYLGIGVKNTVHVEVVFAITRGETQ
jgi:polyisoprenoid-binding protein YceI